MSATEKTFISIKYSNNVSLFLVVEKVYKNNNFKPTTIILFILQVEPSKLKSKQRDNNWSKRYKLKIFELKHINYDPSITTGFSFTLSDSFR